MSEREVRALANKLAGRYTELACEKALVNEWMELAKEFDEALSEPPDVVLLLRWLREEQAETLHSPHWTEDHKTGLLNAFAVVVDRITEKFHICLTADGWEWVDEA